MPLRCTRRTRASHSSCTVIQTITSCAAALFFCLMRVTTTCSARGNHSCEQLMKVEHGIRNTLNPQSLTGNNGWWASTQNIARHRLRFIIHIINEDFAGVIRIKAFSPRILRIYIMCGTWHEHLEDEFISLKYSIDCAQNEIKHHGAADMVHGKNTEALQFYSYSLAFLIIVMLMSDICICIEQRYIVMQKTCEENGRVFYTKWCFWCRATDEHNANKTNLVAKVIQTCEVQSKRAIYERSTVAG